MEKIWRLQKSLQSKKPPDQTLSVFQIFFSFGLIPKINNNNNKIFKEKTYIPTLLYIILLHCLLIVTDIKHEILDIFLYKLESFKLFFYIIILISFHVRKIKRDGNLFLIGGYNKKESSLKHNMINKKI